MNFVLGKALLSLLFYTDNPYFFQIFIPYFSVNVHLKACNNPALSPTLHNKEVNPCPFLALLGQSKCIAIEAS